MKKGFFTIVFVSIALCLSGQNTLYPDSMVLKSLDGKSLNKQISEYDDKGNEYSRIYYIRNQQQDNGWLKYMEYTYEWNDIGNLTSETIFMQDTTLNEWIGISWQTFVLDNNGNETEKQHHAWERETGKWQPNYKCLTTFNEEGTKSEDHSFFGIQNQWHQYQNNKYEYKYDKKGNITQMHQFEINPGDIASYMDAKYWYEYKYDEQGNLTLSVLYQRLDEYQWMPKYRYEYEYDSKGNQTLEIFYWGDTEYVDWKEHYKYGHSYNEDGKLASMFYYSWDANERDWRRHYNYQYYYDSDGNPDYIDLYIGDDNDWVLNEIGHYYYSDQQRTETNITPVDDFSFSIYPNPATDFMTILGSESSNMIIVDLQGRLVYSKKNISNQEIIQTASWQAGAYFVSLQRDGNRTITRKVLKK